MKLAVFTATSAVLLIVIFLFSLNAKADFTDQNIENRLQMQSTSLYDNQFLQKNMYKKNRNECAIHTESFPKIAKINFSPYWASGNHKTQEEMFGYTSSDKPLIITPLPPYSTYYKGALSDITFGSENTGKLNMYGAWADSVSYDRNHTFEKLNSVKSKYDKPDSSIGNINYIYTIGGNYHNNSGLGAKLAYAESDSYLNLYHTNLNYTIPIKNNASIFLEGRYYKGKENGYKWKNDSTTFGGFDTDANLYNFNTRLTIEMISLIASYSEIDAEKKGSLGFFDYNLAPCKSRSTNNFGYWNNRQISSFNHNNEKIWQAGLQYAFDRLGAPGLTLGYFFTQGKDIEATQLENFDRKYKESEHNVKMGYKFQQDSLNGLSLKIEYAHYQVDKEVNEIKNLDSNKDYKNNNKTDMRVYIDYVISVF